MHHVSIRSSVQHHWCFSSSTPSFLKSSYLSNCATSHTPQSLVSGCKRLAQAASCCQLITFLHADTFTVCLHCRRDANADATVPCLRASKCHVMFCAFHAHILCIDRPEHVQMTPAQTAAHYHSHDAFHHHHQREVMHRSVLVQLGLWWDYSCCSQHSVNPYCMSL